MKHKDIERLLIAEALTDPDTGWLSDLAQFDLEYDAANRSITLGGWGSVDISHLTEIVADIATKSGGVVSE